MFHVLWWNFLHMPQVSGIVRPKKLVSRAFAPAIETDLESPHKIFSGQNWMLFVPHDSLTEVKAMFLQERRIVAEIRVATPDIERTTGCQHPGHIPKPGIEQPVELFVGDKVIGQGAILGAQLLLGWLGFAGE